jgi:hypothetical protein
MNNEEMNSDIIPRTYSPTTLLNNFDEAIEIIRERLRISYPPPSPTDPIELLFELDDDGDPED